MAGGILMILVVSLILVVILLVAVFVLVQHNLLGYGKPKLQKVLKIILIGGILSLLFLVSSTQSCRGIGKEMKAENSSDETLLDSASADTETVETTTVEETVSTTSETKFIPYEYEVDLEERFFLKRKTEKMKIK